MKEFALRVEKMSFLSKEVKKDKSWIVPDT
jgi:hypothetical protein